MGLENFILNGVVGGGVGYFTNDLALRLLFRGCCGVKGVIEKEYREFTEGVGRMVERNLLESPLLSSHLGNPQFERAIGEFYRHWLGEKLPEKVGEIKIGEIPGFEQLEKETFPFLLKNGKRIWEEIAPPFPRQLLSSFFYFLAEEVKNEGIGEILPPQFWEKLGEWEREGVPQLPPHLYAHLTRILHRKIGEKLRELGDGKGREIGEIFRKELKNFLSSPRGEEWLKEGAEGFWQSLKGVELTLSQVVGKENSQNLRRWLAQKVEEIVEELAREIEKDRPQLEEEINRVIDRELEKDQLGWLLKKIKDLFISNLANRYQIVEKFIAGIREEGTSWSKQLERGLSQIFEEWSIGKIIASLEREGIVSSPHLYRWEKELFNYFLTPGKIEGWIISALPREREKIVATRLTGYLMEKFPSILSKVIGVVEESRKRESLSPLLRWGGDLFATTPSLFTPSLRPFAPLPIAPLLKRGALHWSAPLASVTTRLLQNHTPTLLKGEIAQLVHRELAQETPRQIAKNAQNLLGNHLQPITLFGGVVGGGIGVATAGIAPPHWSLPLIYGITGLFTNWLAIEMLFRPYRKKWYLPFLSPGALIKGQKRLAQSIARAISSTYLSEEVLKREVERVEKMGEKFLGKLPQTWEFLPSLLSPHLLNSAGAHLLYRLPSWINHLPPATLPSFLFHLLPILPYRKIALSLPPSSPIWREKGVAFSPPVGSLIGEIFFQLPLHKLFLLQWERIEYKSLGEILGKEGRKLFLQKMDNLLQQGVQILKEMAPKIETQLLSQMGFLQRQLVGAKVGEIIRVLTGEIFPSYLLSKRDFLHRLVEKEIFPLQLSQLGVQVGEEGIQKVWSNIWKGEGGRWIGLLAPSLPKTLSHISTLSIPILLPPFQLYLIGEIAPHFLPFSPQEKREMETTPHLFQWKNALFRQIPREIFISHWRRWIITHRPQLERSFHRWQTLPLWKSYFREVLKNYLSHRHQMEEIFSDTLSTLPSTLPLPLLHWIERVGFETLLESLPSHLPPLLQTLQLEKLVEKTIQEMEPAQLEELFREFANPYFRRLILYGATATLFTLPLALG